jgi:hypothetical protein
LNTRWKATPEHPSKFTTATYDGNGIIDMIEARLRRGNAKGSSDPHFEKRRAYAAVRAGKRMQSFGGLRQSEYSGNLMAKALKENAVLK